MLTLSMGRSIISSDWFADASFALCPDFESCSGMAMRFRSGRGCPMSGSDKQKLNTDSSTMAESVRVHDCSPKVLWTPLFLAAQGHDLEEKLAHQDNKSALPL